MCGGTGLRSYRTTGTSGLSPRVRGNPGDCHVHRLYQRSIPACAGEPPPLCQTPFRSAVYPRVCGGTLASGYTSPQYRGLSPRVRGNQPISQNRYLKSRSIPACAGEPSLFNGDDDKATVYPRVCGGTEGYLPHEHPATGLSPRVRGNPIPATAALIAAGSIPACAGEPVGVKGIPHCRRVYPRVCGGT